MRWRPRIANFNAADSIIQGDGAATVSAHRVDTLH